MCVILMGWVGMTPIILEKEDTELRRKSHKKTLFKMARIMGMEKGIVRLGRKKTGIEGNLLFIR